MAIQITTSSIARPSKIYPNWDFWFLKNHLATLRCAKKSESDEQHYMKMSAAFFSGACKKKFEVFLCIKICNHFIVCGNGLPSGSVSKFCLWARVARFFLVHDTKTGKMYQMNKKCTK
jgi:hypothetical protein